jgi:hypothetical protein
MAFPGSTDRLPKRMTIIDAVIIALLLLSGCAFIPFLSTHSPAVVVVYRDNNIIAQYPLSSRSDFSIQGASGPMTVRIKDGNVSVVSSTCPRQICRHTAPVSRPFEQIVCVPNHILIALRSPATRRFDAIAR